MIPETLKISDLRLTAWGADAPLPMFKGSFDYNETVTREPVEFDPARCIEIRANGSETILLLTTPEEEHGFNRFRLTIPCGPDEHFYGCGETFSEFDLKGQRVRIWVAEHQNSRRIEEKLRTNPAYTPFEEYESYYASPVFTSSACYYLYADTDRFMEFDFTVPGEVSLILQEGCRIEIVRADSFPALSEIFYRKHARHTPLPGWIYDGVILASQEGTESIDRKLERCREHDIPVCGVWSQDWCGCRRTGFGYQVMWNWQADDELYPHLREKIGQWKAQGVHFLGYINPFLALEKPLYKYAAEHGYCVKNSAGEDYLVTITTFPAAMIDLTNPEAAAWYKGVIRKNMIDLGMSGWMADFGEYLPVDCVLWSGQSARRMHNRWPAIWARLNAEAIAESGRDDIFFFTRAGSFDTSKESMMMWTGDQHVDFTADDGIGSVIPATLSLAMSGFGIAHSDVGGYTTQDGKTRSAELLMRWEELCAFSPLMRFHEGNRPSQNVQATAGDDLLEHLKKMAGLHVSLKAYLQQCERAYAEHGTPVMAPLFYYFGTDEALMNERTEYMLGPDILVAPVLAEGADSRSVLFPAGEWVHLFTGEHFGAGTHTVAAPIGTPPVFRRAEAAL